MLFVHRLGRREEENATCSCSCSIGWLRLVCDWLAYACDDWWVHRILPLVQSRFHLPEPLLRMHAFTRDWSLQYVRPMVAATLMHLTYPQSVEMLSPGSSRLFPPSKLGSPRQGALLSFTMFKLDLDCLLGFVNLFWITLTSHLIHSRSLSLSCFQGLCSDAKV